MTKKRVAIIFGGRSSEHAISCATAAGVLSALDRERFDVVPIGIALGFATVLAVPAIVGLIVLFAAARRAGARRRTNAPDR